MIDLLIPFVVGLHIGVMLGITLECLRRRGDE